MKQLQSNTGLIILSISIIIASFILTESKVVYQELPKYGKDERKIKVTGDIAAYQIPIGINTNSNDVSYYSEIKVGEGEKLLIQLNNGTQERIEGKNIIGKYFHVAKILSVTYELNERKMIQYFNSPIKWGNEK